MTEEEIKNKISEHKECCKKLAEEYRQRYKEDNADKLALNMFYHNVISFNDFEIILATIEDRNSMMMCFSEPPYLTEETVEVNIKRIAELEVTNKKISDECHKLVDSLEKKQNKNELLETQNIKLQAEVSRLTIKNAELKTKVTALENANRAMVKELDDTTSGGLNILQNVVKNKEELATAKEIISEYINILKGDTKNWKKTQEKAEQFLNSEVGK